MPRSPLSKELFELFSERPTRILYHYTSLSSLRGIVNSKSLYATDIRFFNDAAEMAHTAHLVRDEIGLRLRQTTSRYVNLLNQFSEWVSNRLTSGHAQFVASFTAQGNILSQWRGYCPTGLGVSIGFNHITLRERSEEQCFGLGRCRYNLAEQRKIVENIVDAVEDLADLRGENRDSSKRHPSNSYYDVFEEIEESLLKVAALLKHPAFHEEEEWRVVSPIHSDYVKTPISYREGRSMLLPYVPFSLPENNNGALALEHIFLGPTPNVNLSMTSLSNYLSKNDASPKQGVYYCQIPFRDW